MTDTLKELDSEYKNTKYFKWLYPKRLAYMLCHDWSGLEEHDRRSRRSLYTRWTLFWNRRSPPLYLRTLIIHQLAPENGYELQICNFFISFSAIKLWFLSFIFPVLGTFTTSPYFKAAQRLRDLKIPFGGLSWNENHEEAAEQLIQQHLRPNPITRLFDEEKHPAAEESQHDDPSISEEELIRIEHLNKVTEDDLKTILPLLSQDQRSSLRTCLAPKYFVLIYYLLINAKIIKPGLEGDHDVFTRETLKKIASHHEPIVVHAHLRLLRTTSLFNQKIAIAQEAFHLLLDHYELCNETLSALKKLLVFDKSAHQALANLKKIVPFKELLSADISVSEALLSFPRNLFTQNLFNTLVKEKFKDVPRYLNTILESFFNYNEALGYLYINLNKCSTLPWEKITRFLEEHPKIHHLEILYDRALLDVNEQGRLSAIGKIGSLSTLNFPQISSEFIYKMLIHNKNITDFSVTRTLFNTLLPQKLPPLCLLQLSINRENKAKRSEEIAKNLTFMNKEHVSTVFDYLGAEVYSPPR